MHFSESTFAPDVSPGFLIRVIQQMSFAALDTLFADEGVTGTQWCALVSIHFERATTCVGLARELAHDKGAMTRMIDGMEAKGWVVRERDEADRRIVNLALTDAGRDVALRCKRKAIAWWNGLLADWTEAEVTRFLAQLQRLRTTLEMQA